MAQKYQVKNRLYICALSALCLMAMPAANATSPVDAENNRLVKKEIDIGGRFVSTNKDLNLPTWEGGDSTPTPTCVSKKDGFTRADIHPDAFSRCERRAEKCSLVAYGQELKTNRIKKYTEFEVIDASSTFEKSRVPLIGKVHRNEIFIHTQDLPQELDIWCESKSRKQMTLADAEEILGGLINLPLEREKDRPRASEPPRDGSAAGYVH